MVFTIQRTNTSSWISKQRLTLLWILLLRCVRRMRRSTLWHHTAGSHLEIVHMRGRTQLLLLVSSCYTNIQCKHESTPKPTIMCTCKIILYLQRYIWLTLCRWTQEGMVKVGKEEMQATSTGRFSSNAGKTEKYYLVF